jgi:hypothetical protein
VDCSKTDLMPVLASIPTGSTIKLKGTCSGNQRGVARPQGAKWDEGRTS